tara:strand:+ start:38 stop:538 length:501 start_codon:yes stop_codon:yes gene_type:complete
MNVSIEKIDAFIFDFDGVMTNNNVYIDQEGREAVSCSRADGLALDVLHKINKPSYIISTETNNIVKMRANKLKIPAIQGVSNKEKAVKDLANKNNFDLNKLVYTGNDLNDYYAMSICGFSICPADSHPKIKDISNIVLKTTGGKGVVREILEEVFKLNLIEILYEN